MFPEDCCVTQEEAAFSLATSGYTLVFCRSLGAFIIGRYLECRYALKGERLKGEWIQEVQACQVSRTVITGTGSFPEA